tara:strand:+ start:172 stop:351 length:180 start_codon:yes stop_codon:yes gene_type:complete
MIFKKSILPTPNNERKEIEYIKDVYKYRIQCEIDNYLDYEEKPDSIQSQDILYLDKIFI